MRRILLVCVCMFSLHAEANAKGLMQSVKHGYVDNDGVKIHYVTLGDGPLVLMVHGFPDFWFTWRHQMEVFSQQFQVVAIDLRGYNRSDKPKGVQNYAMRHLIGDVVAVIQHFEQKKAIVIGHDWGGAIAWQVAIRRPHLVEKLVVLSTPHPNGLARELASSSEQQRNSQYARDFQAEGAHKTLTANGLASWVKDPEARKLYLEAFERSDFEAMLNYYKASFPRQNSTSSANNPNQPPKVQCSALVFFGLQDKALLPSGWNGTWEWIDNDLTMVSIPTAGHFVQQDAAEFVTRSLSMWLNR